MTRKRLFSSIVLIVLILGVLSLGLLPSALAQTETPPGTDTTPPSYVDGVQAVPGDSSVTLSWNIATDNVGTTGYILYYGTASVSQAGQEYDNNSEIGDVLTYTLANLENDTTYYFALTALDAAGNESEEYSLEVSATPVASGIEDDGTPPTVVSAVAADCDELTVAFSEAVTLPSTDPESAFTIENLDTYENLEITNAEVLSVADNKVALSTDSMSANAQYLLTVGIEIADRFLNTIVSGTSDTAVFSGTECVADESEDEPVDEPSDEPTDEPADDIDAPKLDSVELVSLTELKLIFNENVVLPEALADETNPALELFSIFDVVKNPIRILEVTYFETEESDSDGNSIFNKTSLSLVTESHKEGTEYFITVNGLSDIAGNVTVGDFKSSASYEIPAPAAPSDTIAPEDVQNIVSSVMDMLINVNWAASLNSAGDLVDNYLYVSTDGGTTFLKKTALGKDATSYAFEGGVEGQEYVFKITTVDEVGNESSGKIVTATLPVTGPALLGLAAAALIGGGILGKKKRVR